MSDLKECYVEPKPQQLNENGTFRSKINYDLRKELERLLKARVRIKDIALKLNITRHQVWFERKRCAGDYNADEAEKNSNVTVSRVISSGLPIYAHQNLVSVYKYLESATEENKPTKIRQYINMSMNILKEMGVSKTINARKPISEETKREVIKLYYDNESYRNIAAKLGISISTVEKLCKNKKRGESYDQYIKTKWSKRS